MESQGNKSKLVLKSLFNEFYKLNENRLKVANIINRKCVYSKRILEWFCSNYSKRNKVEYRLKNNTLFDVYKSYKSKLDSYQKKQFDPFKREREGFPPFKLKYLENGEKKEVITTVGQLNFFKWCIENDIFEYIEKNLLLIKDDMKKFSKNKKEPNTSKTFIKSEKKVVTTRTCVKKFDGVKLTFR